MPYSASLAALISNNLLLAIIQAAAFINSNRILVSKYMLLFKHAGAETELFSKQFKDPSRYKGIDSTIAKI
jgi:hypothetical protein